MVAFPVGARFQPGDCRLPLGEFGERFVGETLVERVGGIRVYWSVIEDVGLFGRGNGGRRCDGHGD